MIGKNGRGNRAALHPQRAEDRDRQRQGAAAVSGQIADDRHLLWPRLRCICHFCSLHLSRSFLCLCLRLPDPVRRLIRILRKRVKKARPPERRAQRHVTGHGHDGRDHGVNGGRRNIPGQRYLRRRPADDPELVDVPDQRVRDHVERKPCRRGQDGPAHDLPPLAAVFDMPQPGARQIRQSGRSEACRETSSARRPT